MGLLLWEVSDGRVRNEKGVRGALLRRGIRTFGVGPLLEDVIVDSASAVDGVAVGMFVGVFQTKVEVARLSVALLVMAAAETWGDASIVEAPRTKSMLMLLPILKCGMY